jgi:hypothetical protein
MPIDKATIRKVIEMLKQGIRPNEICQQLRLGKKIVLGIVQKQEDKMPKNENKDCPVISSPAICPICGRFIKPPCLACKTEEKIQRGECPNIDLDLDVEQDPKIALELGGEYLERYKAIRHIASNNSLD